MNELLPHERHALIKRRLAEDGRVIAADLASFLSISEDTIRRDLREMAAAGHCRRVYGGALPLEAEATPPLVRRIDIAPARKAQLAERVVGLLGPHASLFIDAGSTNLAIARAIPADLPLTLITNAPLIAAALMERPDIDVVLIGGRMDHKSGSILGAKAIAEAASFRTDLCILGSCGLDGDTGVSASFLEEAEFKRAIAAASRQIIAAVTNEKLGFAAPFPVLPLSDRVRLVVEADAPAEACGALEAEGAHIIRAGHA